jgi:hypothetical protein
MTRIYISNFNDWLVAGVINLFLDVPAQVVRKFHRLSMQRLSKFQQNDSDFSEGVKSAQIFVLVFTPSSSNPLQTLSQRKLPTWMMSTI